jgi:hypothetical protein
MLEILADFILKIIGTLRIHTGLIVNIRIRGLGLGVGGRGLGCG